MNPRELRIGNLIDSEKGIITVDHHTFNLLCADFGDMPFKDDLKDIKGIPLTLENFVEELLLELGLEKCDYPDEGNCFVLKIDDLFVSDLYFKFENNQLWFYTGQGYEYRHSVELKYVHQLQNFCYSFAGKELTIND